MIRADKIKKNEDMPLIVKKNQTNSSNSSLFEKTQQLKKFYQNNMPPYPLEDMITIREKALEKREKDMLNKLNDELQHSKFSHE